MKFPEVPSIHVDNPHVDNPQSAKPKESPDLYILSLAWDAICLECEYSIAGIDNLAKFYNVLTGKWHMFVPSHRVDELWKRIVKATLAGTLGIRAEVTLRMKGDEYLVVVYNADYTSETEVNKVRDELRRLGVKERLKYVPDIYFLCKINKKSWGIAFIRYFSKSQ